MKDHEVVLSLIRKGWLRREKGDIYMHPDDYGKILPKLCADF
jgi:hypothetical protein